MVGIHRAGDLDEGCAGGRGVGSGSVEGGDGDVNGSAAGEGEGDGVHCGLVGLCLWSEC